MAGARKPCLQQRRVGRDGDERQPDRHGEEPELPQIGLTRRRLAPGCRQTEGERHQERRQADADMDHARHRRRHPRNQDVGVAVAREQRRLEEEDGDRPHRRRAAEHRQHHLGEHGLHGEQQQRGQERGRRVDPEHNLGARHGRCRDSLRHGGWLGHLRSGGELVAGLHAGIGHSLELLNAKGVRSIARPARPPGSHPDCLARPWAPPRSRPSSRRRTCQHLDRASRGTCRSGRAGSSRT